MNTLYHVPTAYLIASLVFLIMPVLTWFTLRQERSAAVTWWILGGVAISAGLMALGLRQAFPELLPFNTGFTLVVIGEVLHLHALSMERRQGPGLPAWLALALAGAGVKELLYQGRPDSDAHYLFGYAVLTGLVLAASLMARRIAQEEGLRSALWLSRFSLLGALAFAARTLTGVLGLSAPEALNNQASGVLTTFIVVALAMVDNFAMIGIYLERAQHHNAKLLLEQERARAAAELTAQVAHLDRQRSLGELAAGLAHELGQPVTGLLMDASTLKLAVQQDPPAGRELSTLAQDIYEQAGRARQILEGIRNFIKPSTQTFSPLQLTDVIEGARHILAPALRSPDIGVNVRCESSSPWVMGDRVQLTQVLLNLLRNALQARVPGRPLTLNIAVQQAGGMLEVVLEDNGAGMDDEQLARCGTAFYSTKPDGLGIGLALSRRILEHHGGQLLLARAEPGPGLRVTLRLPPAAPA